jgi:hypothetical protein
LESPMTSMYDIAIPAFIGVLVIVAIGIVFTTL